MHCVCGMVVQGPDLHIENDETAIFQNKYHTGRVLLQHYVVDSICREMKEVFMYGVSDRTLHETIRTCIFPGSVITSDM